MRFATTIIGAIVVVSISVACSGEAPQQAGLDVASDPNSPPEINNLLATSWPKVLKTCPGLTKYAADLQFTGVEDNFAFAPADAQRIDIKFKVSEQPRVIPGEYRAMGHTCYFSVNRSGNALAISKSPCSAICRDVSPNPSAPQFEAKI